MAVDRVFISVTEYRTGYNRGSRWCASDSKQYKTETYLGSVDELFWTLSLLVHSAALWILHYSVTSSQCWAVDSGWEVWEISLEVLKRHPLLWLQHADKLFFNCSTLLRNWTASAHLEYTRPKLPMRDAFRAPVGLSVPGLEWDALSDRELHDTGPTQLGGAGLGAFSPVNNETLYLTQLYCLQTIKNNWKIN